MLNKEEMTCQNLTYNNGKYTKIFEEINNEEWSNYCTIISNDNKSENKFFIFICFNIIIIIGMGPHKYQYLLGLKLLGSML